MLGVANAQETGNVEAGHTYAKQVCAECHAVERSEVDILDPPSFQNVADSPGMTERSLAVWLQNPHPNMPNFVLPKDDMKNVIAYIMSLKSAPGTIRGHRHRSNDRRQARLASGNRDRADRCLATDRA
jgi:mono/diheme cytochrome c family protein